MNLTAMLEGRRRRTMAAGAAVVGVIVLVVVLVVSSMGPVAVLPSPSPTASGSQTHAPTPPGDWAALDLAPYAPIAELVPVSADASGVDPASAFTLRSLDGGPAAALASRLEARPSIELAVVPGPTDDIATVRPTTPLVAGARYSVELRDETGALQAQWAFRTAGPLHVVHTFPGNRTTGVPVDSGIEIEFDHDGVTGVAEHLAIQPPVAGRLEQHGRTWAWVPNADLAPETLYTVVVSPGVGIDGSAQVLETEARFEFETSGPSSDSDDPRIVFPAGIQDARPGEPPALQVEVWGSLREDQTLTRRVELYALPDLGAALEAARILSVDRSWAPWSSTGAVATEGLTQVAEVDASVVQDSAPRVLPLPITLDAGWYLANVPQAGRDAQALIQVGDLAVYAVTSRTRTLTWVNDLASGARPVAGARVDVDLGSALGQTDASGLLDAATPSAMRSAASGGTSILVVSASDGRRVIAPLRAEFGPYFGGNAGTDWWQVLQADRNQYRQLDTIHLWGMLRSRGDLRPPASAELRLTVDQGMQRAVIATATARPSDRGAFVADIPIRGLPLGFYQVELFVSGTRVGGVGVEVTEIRKPAFRVELSTDRRVYLRGDKLRLTTTAAFYDGSTAPGLTLRNGVSGVREEADRTLTLDGTGSATVTLTATTSMDQPDYGSAWATPAQPEEGSSYGQATFMVLPSNLWITTEARVASGMVAIDGSLARVDLAKAEEQMDQDGWVTDAGGAPAAGQRIGLRVVHMTWTSRVTGTTYDFLQKKRVPRVIYETHSVVLGTYSATSADDGSFQLSVPAPDADGWFEVEASAADSAGRRIVARTTAASAGSEWQEPSALPQLTVTAQGEAPDSFAEAAPGDSLSISLREPDGTASAGQRTLFMIDHLGISQAVITTTGVLNRAFGEADLPGIRARAVQVSPAGYFVSADVNVVVVPSAKAINLALEPDRASYAPGDEVTIAVTTTGPDGRPIAADVVVQAVDQKLYAIGAANQLSTDELMRQTAAGFVASYASHQVNPRNPWGDGYGATTGGGGDSPREDFRDVALFTLARTDASGRGMVSFELPDDLTSWRISAAAVGSGLESGSSSIEVAATLRLFVDATVAGEYLVGDQPTIQLRAFGNALEAGDVVRFTVAAPSLGLAERSYDGTAFTSLGVALPSLPEGEHRVTVGVEQVGATPRLRDRVVRTLRVIPSRIQSMMTSYAAMDDGYVPDGGDGLTTYVIADSGRGGVLPMLERLAAGADARFDTALAADLARAVLIEEFGLSDASLPPSGYDPLRSQGAVRLLPYADPELFLSARTALVAPERVAAAPLAEALRSWTDVASATRERQVVALAGLAGLGHDVLGELRALASDDMTVPERLWLALGLLAAGDTDGAREIERSLLAEHGRRLGQWVRLEAPDAASTGVEASGLMLLLSARLGDPVAVDIARYLHDNPSPEQIAPLAMVGAIRAMIEWMPREAARFSWTIDGERNVEDLEPGATFVLVVTGEQRRTLAFEALRGELIVAASWSGETSYHDLPSDPMVTIARTVTPAGSAPADGLVRVSLKLTVAANAPAGCFQVTDLLPSGLAPLASPLSAGYESATTIAPYEVVGQRVSWCVDAQTARTKTLAYTAHVVTPGTFRWEPAVVQLVDAPSIGAWTPAATYTIE